MRTVRSCLAVAGCLCLATVAAHLGLTQATSEPERDRTSTFVLTAIGTDARTRVTLLDAETGSRLATSDVQAKPHQHEFTFGPAAWPDRPFWVVVSVEDVPRLAVPMRTLTPVVEVVVPDPAEVRLLAAPPEARVPHIIGLRLVATKMPLPLRVEHRSTEGAPVRVPAGEYAVTASCSDGIERRTECTLVAGVSEACVEGEGLRVTSAKETR